jgi:cytochrome P450
VQRARRIATRRVELRGAAIAAGDAVLAFTGSANRDPEAFADPDRLDVRRRPARTLAFGYGPHFCAGAALARLEAPLMLGALLARFGDLRLAGPVRFRDNIVFRGPEALRLQPGRAA